MLLALAMMISLQPEGVKPNCAGNTLEINACLAIPHERSEARLHKYLEAALNRYADNDQAAVKLGIQASQDAFEAYRSIECATVYEDSKDGTIRDAMQLSCETDLDDQRTHDIWAHWLLNMDNTPPILPEPQPEATE